VLLLGALSVGLPGCRSDNADLPTLIGKAEPTQSSSDAHAQQLYDCLEAAGIPAVIESTDSGLLVDFDIERFSRYSIRGPMGLALDYGYPSDYQWSDEEWAFLYDGTDHWRLIMDGIDMSEAYAQCRNSIPYTEPWLVADPAQETKDRKAIADASNQWAKCARENGWPLVSDVQPGVPDGYRDIPTVLLPGTMSVPALESLLEACPPYAPEKYVVKGFYPNIFFQEVPIPIDQDPLAEVDDTQFAELRETLHRALDESYESSE